MGVDILVDTSSACNLMSTFLRKKLGLVVEPCTKKLVTFSRATSQTMGVEKVEIKLREWSKLL